MFKNSFLIRILGLIAFCISPSLLAQEKIAWISGIDQQKGQEPALPSLKASGFTIVSAAPASAEKATPAQLSDWLNSQSLTNTHLWVEIHGDTSSKEIDTILSHLDQAKGLTSTFLLIDGSSSNFPPSWSPTPSPKRSSVIRITSKPKFFPILSRTLHSKNLTIGSSPTLHASLFRTILTLKKESPKDFHHLSSNPPSATWWNHSLPKIADAPTTPSLTTPSPTTPSPTIPSPDSPAPIAKVTPMVAEAAPISPALPTEDLTSTPPPAQEPDLPQEVEQDIPERPAHLSQYFANSPLSESYLIHQSRTLRLAQSRLKSLNLYQSRIDGSPGPGTHRAIVSFQQNHQIPVTGILDAPTLESLKVEIPADNFRNDIRGLNPLKDSSRYRYFRSSDRYRVIKEVQRVLKEQNHYQGSLDGSAGPMFFEALLDFQNTHQLSKTLTIDSATQSELTKIGMRRISATPSPKKTYTTKYYPKKKSSSKSSSKRTSKSYSKPKPRKAPKKSKARPKSKPSSPKVLPYLE